MIRKIIQFALSCISCCLITGALTSLNAFECVGTGTADCLQCHAVQEGIHTPHWSRQIGIYPNCTICHCGQKGSSICDASATNTRGPVETVCCESCHEKCAEVDSHSYAHTTTVEPTTTVIITTSSTGTSTSTTPETTTTTSIEPTTSTTIEATTTVVDPLTLCLPCHSECEDTTSIPVQRMHDGRCRTCHPSSKLHAQPGHDDCAQCHRGGVTRAGNVDAGTCTASCHPSGNPGTCNLVNDHDPSRDTDCLNCHQECVVTTTTTTMPDCDISILPSIETVYSEQTVQFTAETSGEGCLTGVHQWELDTVINSQLDSDGGYTSGFNTTGEPVTDTIVVEDTANHIIIEWPIVVRFEKITRVVPNTLWRSKWVMLPQVMNIQGEGTHFSNESTVVMFFPSASVIPSWQTVLNETLIWNFLLVMPAWYSGQNDEQAVLMVITGDEVLTKQVAIDQFPLYIDDGE